MGITRIDHLVVKRLDVQNETVAGGQTYVDLANAATDEKAKVSSGDTTPGFIQEKLLAGTNITLTKNNAGGNETLTIGMSSATPGFTTSVNTTAPNDVIHSAVLQATAASTNADIVLQPKGTGALTARLADGTYLGGNKRGYKAVDLQLELYDNTDVASGDYSVISGGTGSRSTGYGSVCVGGDYNWVDGQWGVVTGGYINRVYAEQSTIVNGRSNTIAATGQFGTVSNSTILGGEYGYITASYSVSLSSGNTIHAKECTVVGGYGNTIIANSFGGSTLVNSTSLNITRPNVTVINGSGTSPKCIGSISYGHKYYPGMLEEVVKPITVTSNATPKEMTLDSGAPRDDDFWPGEYYNFNNRIVVPNDTTYVFEGVFVARRQNGDNESAGYKVTGIIDNNAGTVAFAGTPTVTVIHEDVPAWNLAVTADDTNNALVFTATGEAGKTIHWFGTVRLYALTA